MAKILITDTMHESIVSMLETIGYQVDYNPTITREQIISGLSEYTGIMVRSKTYIDKEVIDAGSNLKFIARSGAGLDLIDIEHTQKKNIALLNAPEGNRDAVAEHTVAMILNLLNYIRRSDYQVRHKIWDREGNRGHELMHRTVGLIGFGNMGTATAKRLSGFGCRIIVYDKYKSGFGTDQVEEVSLDKLKSEADIISFHVPLTEETRHYLDNSFLDDVKNNFILINTSRGEVASLNTIIQGLSSGKITSAGLDVMEIEKFKKLTAEQDGILDQLFDFDQVIFTPHVAGWTTESYIKINETLVNKIKALNLA